MSFRSVPALLLRMDFRSLVALLALVAAPGSAPAAPADELSLKQAVALALQKNGSIEAAAAGVEAAGARIRQARSGFLPKVNYSESVQRGNNPVYVFGSLLTQHQFTERNFDIGSLNRPDFLNNFQSQVSVMQPVWDARQTRTAVRQAEIGKQMAGEDDRRTRMQVIAGVVRAYYGAVLASQALGVAEEAVRSAEADLKRGQAIRQAGMSTDADVLSIKVHLAGATEQKIRRRNDLEVARAALNDALGLPLDTPHDLTTKLEPADLPGSPALDYERQALENRPEARMVKQSAALADTGREAARSAFLPQVFVQGVFEADRQRFYDRGGANWFAGATLRWNLYNGGADQARVAETMAQARRAAAELGHTENALRLQVRSAYLDLASAQERVGVAQSAVAMAEESLRITRNRFEAGLTTVTELLRSETAMVEVRTRRLAAIHDRRVAEAALELAAGTLSADSRVLD
jgi:outer membrane protein